MFFSQKLDFSTPFTSTRGTIVYASALFSILFLAVLDFKWRVVVSSLLLLASGGTLAGLQILSLVTVCVYELFGIIRSFFKTDKQVQSFENVLAVLGKYSNGNFCLQSRSSQDYSWTNLMNFSIALLVFSAAFGFYGSSPILAQSGIMIAMVTLGISILPTVGQHSSNSASIGYACIFGVMVLVFCVNGAGFAARYLDFQMAYRCSSFASMPEMQAECEYGLLYDRAKEISFKSRDELLSTYKIRTKIPNAPSAPIDPIGNPTGKISRENPLTDWFVANYIVSFLLNFIILVSCYAYFSVSIVADKKTAFTAITHVFAKLNDGGREAWQEIVANGNYSGLSTLVPLSSGFGPILLVSVQVSLFFSAIDWPSYFVLLTLGNYFAFQVVVWVSTFYATKIFEKESPETKNASLFQDDFFPYAESARLCQVTTYLLMLVLLGAKLLLCFLASKYLGITINGFLIVLTLAIIGRSWHSAKAYEGSSSILYFSTVACVINMSPQGFVITVLLYAGCLWFPVEHSFWKLGSTGSRKITGEVANVR